MPNRKQMVDNLIAKIGIMRTMVLVGYINQFPKLYRNDPDLYFIPNHDLIIKELKVKQSIYWSIVAYLESKGLIYRRHVKGIIRREIKINFPLIEDMARWQRLAKILLFIISLTRSQTWRHLLSALTARLNSRRPNSSKKGSDATDAVQPKE